ncbi:hypothetical protein [Saccharothrix australiensis]|uniref:Uncharacterized protein n=1 Tax=Saccharothrix australiensis TaxID=2072 RepID=A0A495W821_9PSEU|nr:hypothetical protein [Saccharothrix australiensis]RKT57826.1 hypothetical protein C8E97_6556 [Saccharothrix australiensis]
MLVITELPFVDLRPFLAGDRVARLARPAWPLPLVGHEFVRDFGVVRATPDGGLHPWSGEEYFCAASSALTFRGSPTKNPRVRLVPRYRRMLTNGVVGRVEVAFQVSNRFDLDDVARSVADLPVRVRGAAPGRLAAAGLALAKLYSKATTPVSCRDRAPALVVPGQPLILVERRGLRGDGVATVMEDPETGVLLEHLWETSVAGTAALWAVSHGSATAAAVVRQVRVHAMRLHCESQAFTSVLRACLTGRLSPATSEPLRDYLHGSAKRILRPRYESLPQRGLLAGLAKAYADLTPSVTASVEAAFRNVSPSLTRLVAEAAELGRATAPDRPAVLFVNIKNTDGGKVIVGDNNVEKTTDIHIGDGARVQGAVGSDIGIGNSAFGDGARSGVDLPALLRQLVTQLEQLGPTADEQVELARMAEVEAAAAEPSRSRIRALVSGVLSAVREAGEAAAPAIQTAEAIRQALG